MAWPMANKDVLGRVESDALTANYTCLDWMNSWNTVSYVAESTVEIQIFQEQSWDNAMERILQERKDAWKILANL